MNRTKFLVALFLLFNMLNIHAQKSENMKKDFYAKAWDSIEAYVEDDLPKSAIKEAEKIYGRALRENNFAQAVRAGMTLVAMRGSISPDSMSIDVEELESKILGRETSAKTNRDWAELALLHILAASIYEYWDYTSLTLSDEEAQDISKKRKIEHVQAAMAHAEDIAGISVEDCRPLFSEVGSDSRFFNNDALSMIIDFVGEECNVTGSELWRLTQRAASAYKAKGMRDAYALMHLRELDLQKWLDDYSMRIDDEAYESALKQMFDNYSDTAVGADIWQAWMSWHKFDTAQEEVDLAREALLKWPDSDIKGNFEGRIMELMSPWLYIYTRTMDDSHTEIAGKPLKVSVAHRNLDDADIRIVRLVPNKENQGVLLCKTDEKNMVETETVWTQHLSFDYHKSHSEQAEDNTTDSLFLTLPAGCYRMYVTSGGVEAKTFFHLTSLQVITMSMPGGVRHAMVVDAISGAPIQDCEVIGQRKRYIGGQWKTFTQSYTTDKEGRVVIDSEVDDITARLNANDESIAVAMGRKLDYDKSDEQMRTVYQAFTDRAIYRPGQKVYVSGFVYSEYQERFNVLPNKKVDFILYDANWEVLQKTTVVTDNFGVASTEFILPEDRLNGLWRIKFGDSYCNVRVEEYKRPTFTVEMEETEGHFSLGDTIEVSGIAKTFSGVPVQNAQVEYSISLAKSTSWYRWLGGYDWSKAETGTIKTDEDGRFRVKLYLDDSLVRNSQDMNAEISSVDGRSSVHDFEGMMCYRVEAKVTDLGGETQEAQKVLHVTARDFTLNLNNDDLIDRGVKRDLEVNVSAINTEGQAVDVRGTWMLKRYNATNLKYDIEVSAGEFVSGQTLSIPIEVNYELGSYQIIFRAKDSHNHLIETSSCFIVWNSVKGGKMNLAEDWLYAPVTELEPGKSVDVWYAVNTIPAHTYMYVMDGANVIQDKFRVIDNSIQHQRILYKPEYTDGMRFVLVYVKDGKEHQIGKTFTLVRPQKTLKIEWATFRDKLTPGQKETWTLRVKDADGNPVLANVMTGMYDASLDAFVRNSWPFSLNFYRNIPPLLTYFSQIGQIPYLSLSFPNPDSRDYTRQYNQLRPFSEYGGDYGFISRGFGRKLIGGVGIPLREPAAAPLMVKSMATVDASAVEDEAVADNSAEAEPTDANDTAVAPQANIRENFNETAYFFPTLHTASDGSVDISFTLPDCLTEWRVMNFAHTSKVDYGQLESTVVARKEFMVQPNMPRFVRQGDKLSLATKIINTSERNCQGEAYIRLINPETDEIVMTDRCTFSVDTNSTTSVVFSYDVPEQYSLLICEISASANGFSDGERNYLPILTSKKIITETIPFYLDGPNIQSISLEPLFNNHSATATLKRMTFEYTDNPSWQAILALHSVITPTNDNLIDWSASLYANRVLQSMAKRMPQLIELIMRWNAEESEETTLESELQKNQELKEILLQESPWMLDAEDETAQRQKLCEMFDQKMLTRRVALATDKLKTMQFANGGWSWFKGMEPSYYITLCISEHLANLLNYLNVQGEKDDVALSMLRKSIQYLDDQELTYYNKYAKKDKKSLPSESTLRYLYLRTLVPEALKKTESIQVMKKFYLDKTVGKVGALTMFGRANVAVILYDDKRYDAARKFVQSLHEYTVFNPGMGRYFDTDKALYSWCDYRIPTQIAAMKSFMSSLKHDTKGPDGLSRDDLVEMQLWLLRQKQAQKWDNVINTLAVVDLLLTINPEVTFHESQLPVVQFDEAQLPIPSQTAGVGYSKIQVPDSMTSTAALTVTKQSPGISWGCIYGQCLESLDQVSQTVGELKVERKLYVQRNGEWQAFDSEQQLYVGDKIRIRNIVTADRDMDFVQLRSQYAACLEPLQSLSGYQWLGGRGCYLAMHDSSADLFFDSFRKGTSTLDLEFYVTRTGCYSLGISTVQCAYTPAFSGHSSGMTINVNEK